NLTQSIRGPITDLAATLLAAWASYGAGDAKTAIESIDKLQGADWYALFKDLHAGLILDLSGNKKEAGKRFDRAQKLDATALRLAPNQPLALLSLADLYEQVKNPTLAIKIYERMPQNSPLRRNAEIQMAINLDTIEKTDEAKQRLQKLLKDHPDDIDAIMALG